MSVEQRSPDRREAATRTLHVYLTGFMGAGKSTVGRRLAERLGWRFVDLDETIEGTVRRSIPDIFERFGEAGFRRWESSILRSLDEGQRTVVATGGGAIVSPENRSWMRDRGITVWLDAPFSILRERLQKQVETGRPLLGDERQARRLYERRLAAYGEADLRVEIAADQSVEEVTDEVLAALREERCAI